MTGRGRPPRSSPVSVAEERGDTIRFREAQDGSRQTLGLRITPYWVVPFMVTRAGLSNRRCRTGPISSIALASASQSQSTKPSPISWLMVKYPMFREVRF